MKSSYKGLNIKLSICIPTYNRGAFIGETLHSIFSQNNHDIEVVISDNASKDNTSEIVFQYQQHNMNINYYRWDKNMGADINYLKVIDLASGQYCWFLGSDDKLIPGSIERIMEEIKKGYDIILCNRINCTYLMKPIKVQHLLKSNINDRTFNLSNKHELIDYFDKSQSVGAVFSYLSSIIFLRDKWNQIEYDNDFTGTAYSHVYKLLGFIKNGCILKYIKTPYVYNRSGNDSFSSEGKLNRFLIDIEGYKKLGDYYFKHDEDIRKSFLNILVRYNSWVGLYYARIYVKNNKEWDKIEKLLHDIGSSMFKLKIVKHTRIIGEIGKFIKKILKKLYICSI